jgi:hypothetical protein
LKIAREDNTDGPLTIAGGDGDKQVIGLWLAAAQLRPRGQAEQTSRAYLHMLARRRDGYGACPKPTNIFKHARAHHVSIILTRHNNEVQLIVEDDGRGFDPDERLAEELEPRRLGLIGMQERAALIGGSLLIEAAPGRGTSVFLRAPPEGDATNRTQPATTDGGL